MENENNTKQDCSCGTDCCTPRKSNLWMKIVFIVIVVAAVTIVTVKLVSNDNKAGSSNSAVTIEKSSCSDTTKACDPKKNPSCCPKNKN
ncbi:MAG: hypothetical protein V1904_13410 [Bacteroidota bacterium]